MALWLCLCKITISCLSLGFGELFFHLDMVLFKYLDNGIYHELYFRSIQVVWENTMFWSGSYEYCDQIIGERYKCCMNWEELYISNQEMSSLITLNSFKGNNLLDWLMQNTIYLQIYSVEMEWLYCQSCIFLKCSPSHEIK